MSACDACLARSALYEALSGEIEFVRRSRRYVRDVLALPEADLRAAIGSRADGVVVRDPDAVRAAADAAGIEAICRHDAGFPDRLRDDRAVPAVLYAAGDVQRRRRLLAADVPAVAVVGARNASADGLECARLLARGLSAAGVTVVSGLALGIDGAAHDGALAAGARTVAVLAGAAEIPYPRRRRATHAELVERACVLSEAPPGGRSHSWRFLARNRIIAGLGDVTVVVEAAERSGSLVTADFALELGRDVGAVPGNPLGSRSAGSNALLRDGAVLIRGAADVLELPAVAGGRLLLEAGSGAGARRREPLPAAAAALLADVEAGNDRIGGLAGRHGGIAAVQALVTDLELRGYLRRLDGGRLATI